MTVNPALALLERQLDGRGGGVALVPIRETETWAVWDGDALRQVFGSTLSDQDLGLAVNANLLESMADPKAALNHAFLATRPSGRCRKQGVSPLLNALGEQVSLDRLRQVAGFARFEAELKQALRELRIL